MPYATPDDLKTTLGLGTPPANAGLLLTRAQRIIDRALLTAVYAVDGQGQPTNPDTIAALRDATVEQAASWLTPAGDTAVEVPDAYAQVQIASATLQRDTSRPPRTATGSDELAPQAALALRQADELANLGPWTW